MIAIAILLIIAVLVLVAFLGCYIESRLDTLENLLREIKANFRHTK